MTGTTPIFSRPTGVALGRSGYVYVVSQWQNPIQKFTTGGSLVNGWGSTGTGDGQFNSPRGIAVDNNENVYVADTGNSRIQKFSSDGLYLMQWGSVGTGTGSLTLLEV